MKKFIDLRSDTVTKPTPEMREAMANAVVGDDVYEDDPTVRELEELSAEMVGTESALFVPSGTMGNQLAIMVQTKRGDEIIVSEQSHIYVHEVGAAGVLAGVNYRVLTDEGFGLKAEQIKKAIRAKDIHFADTSLVCLENALANGMTQSVEEMKNIHELCKKHGLKIHLDGARLFNAALYLGVSAKEIVKYCDSVMFCLSKGLCSPVGSILAGNKEFISKARKYRKLLGGGMRQAGVLAACGLISLKDMTKRLHVDHENAEYLHAELSKLKWVKPLADKFHINMVFLKVDLDEIEIQSLEKCLSENNIKFNSADGNEYRFVTHNDLSREDIDYVIDVMKEFGKPTWAPLVNF